MYFPGISEAVRTWRNGSRLHELRQRQDDTVLRAIQHELRAMESTLDLCDRYVDPNDDLFDASGRWSAIGLASAGAIAPVYQNEQGLKEVRDHGRLLWNQNPFARCGHENRVNYIAGDGHQYRVEMKPGEKPDEELLDDVRNWLDKWITANRWYLRQQESVWRRDRDGEAFLRFFPGGDGMLLVRFLEPEHITTPASQSGNPNVRYGIEFDPDDAETAVGYFVNSEFIEANEVQHRKDNVDLASPRGVPLFYPVRTNLRRALTLLRSISILATSRSMTPWIERHLGATQAQVQSYLDGKTDISVTSSKGDTTDYQRVRPGTVRHVRAQTEFEYPPAPEIAQQIAGIQAELRAVASRVCMPEFMLTSDASNANYASTMVAEGPAVKAFERAQADTIAYDEEVLTHAREHAVASGVLPQEAIDLVDIVAQGPSVRTRDRLKDAQADQILVTNKAMSKQTLASRHNLDYKAEKENMEEEADQESGYPVPPSPFGGAFGQGQNSDPGDKPEPGD